MEPAYKILRRALAWYEQRENVAYWYGAKGQVLTDEIMDDLVGQYYQVHFQRYTDAQIKKLKRWSIGKIGFDCSGFVTDCLQSGIMYTGAIWDKCVNKTSIALCKAGSVLWRPGHVGLDIGYGYAIQIGIEGQTITLEKNDKFGFEGGGEFADYDYSMMCNY